MASFLLRSGRAAQLPVSDALARCEFLAVAAVSGDGSRGRIRLAAQLNRQQLEELFGSQISTEDSVSVSDDGAVLARRRQTLGSLLLRDEPLPRPDAGTCAEALCEFIHQGGPQILARLPWNDEIRQWRARVSLLRELDGDPWPDLSDAALLGHPETWLAPYLMDCTALRRLTSGRLLEALRGAIALCSGPAAGAGSSRQLARCPQAQCGPLFTERKAAPGWPPNCKSFSAVRKARASRTAGSH